MTDTVASSDEEFTHGCKGVRWRWGVRKAPSDRRHADDFLKHATYNDEPDPAVKETVERLVDTSKVIELERINLDVPPKKYGYRFVKRVLDIASCSAALAAFAIPMEIIAILVKRDSPGPVFYRQERLGWDIRGQKSGAAREAAFRLALSALEAFSVSHFQVCLGVAL